MNNKNLIAVFFGLACLVLLVGVFSVSNTLNGNNQPQETAPQQINKTIATPPAEQNKPLEINKNDIINPTNQEQNNILDPNNGNMTGNENNKNITSKVQSVIPAQ